MIRATHGPLGVVLVLASASLLAQQAPPQTAGGKPAHLRVICTPVPKGEIVRRVLPVYPREVLAKVLAEGVDIKLTIDKQGVPKDLQVTKGDPMLAKSALDAVRQWRWRPYKLNGEAVEVDTSVYIRFEPARQ